MLIRSSGGITLTRATRTLYLYDMSMSLATTIYNEYLLPEGENDSITGAGAEVGASVGAAGAPVDAERVLSSVGFGVSSCLTLDTSKSTASWVTK